MGPQSIAVGVGVFGDAFLAATAWTLPPMLAMMAVKELIGKQSKCRETDADDADAVLDHCPDEQVHVCPCVVSTSQKIRRMLHSQVMSQGRDLLSVVTRTILAMHTLLDHQ